MSAPFLSTCKCLISQLAPSTEIIKLFIYLFYLFKMKSYIKKYTNKNLKKIQLCIKLDCSIHLLLHNPCMCHPTGCLHCCGTRTVLHKVQYIFPVTDQLTHTYTYKTAKHVHTNKPQDFQKHEVWTGKRLGPLWQGNTDDTPNVAAKRRLERPNMPRPLAVI